jgi:hypothetical protein
MVTFGLGGALGNLLAGYLRGATGSLAMVYGFLSLTAVLLVVVGLYIIYSGRRQAVGSTAPQLADAA